MNGSKRRSGQAAGSVRAGSARQASNVINSSYIYIEQASPGERLYGHRTAASCGRAAALRGLVLSWTCGRY